MSTLETPAWLGHLKRALSKNKRDAHNRYFQLATMGQDGHPRVRTLVFRGFSDVGWSLFSVTDARSDKISELACHSRVELSWYFTQTREQFRLRGEATVSSTDSDPEGHRSRLWSAMSEAARAQFFWPTPGAPLGDNKAPGFSQTPPETFAVIEYTPVQVDDLVLAKTQSRSVSEYVAGRWRETPINP